MATIWWRRALQQRLGTLAAAALILWTVGTAVAASIATSRIVDALTAERTTRARSVAARVQLTLQDELRTLDRIAGAAIDPSSPRAVAAEVRGLRLADLALRMGPGGQVLWTRAVASGEEMPSPLARIAPPAAGRWRAEGTPLLETAVGPRAFLVLPVRESDPVGGAMAAAIEPRSSALGALLASYASEPYVVELIDDAGTPILRSRSVTDEERRDAIVATALVSNGPWRIRLSQSRAAAIQPVLTLRRILVGSSLLLLPFAVLAALATARSIRQPVIGMTAAAERLARGSYSEPIPAAGVDELGRLAAALEELRRTLEADERRNLLLKRVISAQEEERRRIARELHDQTAQQLTALAMQIESASTAHPEARPALRQSHNLVMTAIDDLHRVMYDLRPSMLDDLGLLPAIRSYAETHLAARGVTVLCEFPETMPPLSRDAATALFRIAQEALTNIARHARAETVMIACTATDRLVLEIEDDGVGFDPRTVARPRESGEGLGLLGMRERLALLGGALRIESEPGRGTRVEAVLPLHAHVEATRT